MHAESKFGFGDTHSISEHRSRAPSGITVSRSDPPCHRAIDIDVLLTGFAGRGDLPTEQIAIRIIFDRRLDCVGLSAVARSL
jgi:hypothetical protein